MIRLPVAVPPAPERMLLQEEKTKAVAARANIYNVCFIAFSCFVLEVIAQAKAYGALVHDAVVKHVSTDRKL